MKEIHSGNDTQRRFEVGFYSLHNFRIQGWLTLPRHAPVGRGMVVGHGYDGREGPDLALPRRASIFGSRWRLFSKIDHATNPSSVMLRLTAAINWPFHKIIMRFSKRCFAFHQGVGTHAAYI